MRVTARQGLVLRVSRRAARRAAWRLAVLGLAGVASLDALAQSAVSRCDRPCLSGLLADYLGALEAHDPSRLPLAPDVIFTENGRLLEIGDGAWRTVGARLDYRDDLLDPETGGAAALTAFHEAEGVVQYFVRLAVADRRITEIESIAVRASDVRWFAAENLESLSDLFMTPVEPARRLSREELVAGARAYFTAVETEGTPEFVQAPFAPGMNRIENGLQTTNAPPGVARLDRHAWSADEQLERAAYAGTKITDTRYPIVDVERGSVLAIPVFHFPGDNAPTVLAAEIFKVTGGRLREIRAVLQNLPRGAGPGWSPKPRYAVRQTSTPVAIDGALDDAAWADASPAVTLQFLWDEQTGAKQRTFVQMLWDADALYVGFRADDTDITARFLERDDPTFLDDAVEIFINPAPEQKAVYFGYEMNARGVLYDYLNHNNRMLFKRFDATGLQIGVARAGTLNDRHDTDTGWTLEIAIPWENFDPLSRRAPAPGTVWEANLNRWDGVEPDRRMSIWSDPMNDESWPHVPSRFGELHFVD
ncbi:MAG: carbohydrate-binding family 9-like protein [Gammaproteobacteria bacterium]|nr:carbohydrate-binding family 9-like protein [Gammaproteobacteria bacterium]